MTNRELKVLSSPAGAIINVLSLKYKNEDKPKSNVASPNTSEAQEDNKSLVEQLKAVEGKIAARMVQEGVQEQ
jgi:hypothetical protein